MAQTTVSKTAVAAGNYAAGDVVSESATNGVGTAWRFGGIESRAGQGSYITNANIVFSGAGADAVAAVYKLWLFSANPSTSELDDNAAKSFSAADMANFLGILTFQAAVDQGSVAVAVLDLAKTQIPFMVVPVRAPQVAGSDGVPMSIWGVLEDTSGETNEAAGMVVTINLTHIPTMLLNGGY